MKMPKLFLGPMSKNIVDSIIKLNDNDINIGIIPSRRQIEYTGGYVNLWTTKEFVKYVKDRNKNIVICRDHGGPMQGEEQDDGKESLKEDCINLDMIHIDPWKTEKSFKDCLQDTVNLINFCFSLNNKMLFEIGTEEGIRKFTAEQIYDLINYVRLHVNCFENIKFVVIQSGTNLKLDINIGNYNEKRLIDMVNIAKEFNLLTKEHNGDYLESSLIHSKFNKGLDAINIAPEIGRMETECYLEKMNIKEINSFFQICYDSKKWVKWVKGDNSFNPFDDKEKLIKICGHYVFSDKKFIELFNYIYINDCLFEKIKKRIIEII